MRSMLMRIHMCNDHLAIMYLVAETPGKELPDDICVSQGCSNVQRGLSRLQVHSSVRAGAHFLIKQVLLSDDLHKNRFGKGSGTGLGSGCTRVSRAAKSSGR